MLAPAIRPLCSRATPPLGLCKLESIRLAHPSNAKIRADPDVVRSLQYQSELQFIGR